MPFDISASKLRSRQALHKALAVSASYEDTFTHPPKTGVTVRWHNKIVRNGASDDGFDATILEGIDRLVFQASNLAAVGVALQSGGTVRFRYADADLEFLLVAQEKSDGPENVYWSVSRP